MSDAISSCVRFAESIGERMPDVDAPILSAAHVGLSRTEKVNRSRGRKDRQVGRRSVELATIHVRNGLTTKPMDALLKLKTFSGKEGRHG